MDQISLLINGKEYTVKPGDGGLGPDSRLVDFIRDGAGLKGTKWTCREGGCGACVISVKTKCPQTGEPIIRAVNSCLIPIWACDGWSISTVENLGNKINGYHPIQKRMAKFGGSQCGFCTPGWLMNFYSLASSKGDFTVQDVEDNFDGHICRCTGYRPIFDTFKSFAVDGDPELKKRAVDNEGCCGGNASGGGCCRGNNSVPMPLSTAPSKNLDFSLPSGENWVKATNLQTAFAALTNFTRKNLKYRVVGGNTGTGIFKDDGPYDAYVDVNNVPDLHVQSVNLQKGEAIFGTGNSLSRAIAFFETLSQQPGFEYTAGMRKHFWRIANTAVRNVGSLAGNLMMKHAHHGFPSDVFMLLETVGAKVTVASSPTDISSHSPVDFLKVDMRGKLILYISLPKRANDGRSEYFFRSYKITKRYQNHHAYVNAGFLFRVDPAANFKVLERPSITFGGINEHFLHASKTETKMTGIELGDNAKLREAIKILEAELEPDFELPEATPQYRKLLSMGLLYKTVLKIVKGKVNPRIQSGGDDLPRKSQTATQSYDHDSSQGNSPLYKPVQKLEALKQCSGEAEFVNDIPKLSGELYGAFVKTTVANAMLKCVDASAALKIPGVVKFLQAKDIPGVNTFNDGVFVPVVEELFVDKKIKYSGQAVGLIVAESQDIANFAVKQVKVEYDRIEKPLIDLKEGVENARKNGTIDSAVFLGLNLKSLDEPNRSSKHVVKGEFRVGGQAHFPMENHVTVSVPNEDGVAVFSATQWPDSVQGQVAKALNIPNNTVDVQTRRLGGGFGSKITRSNQMAVASALAAHLTRKPVRIVLDLDSNMEMAGKRMPYYAIYEAGFNDAGKIDKLDAQVFCDTGMADGEADSLHAITYMQNCYAANGWTLRPGRLFSNTPANSFTRAPGTTQGIAIIETVIEHIAHTLGKDSWEIRNVNMLKVGDPLLPSQGKEKFEGQNLIPGIVDEMKKVGNLDERKKAVEEFNRNNRWIKKGLAMVPMRYLLEYHGPKFPSYVAIHHQDATVVVSHGGIEMGQGINTKVAQACAHAFGIPLEKIVVKPTNNLVGINAAPTGEAVTSELVCYATIKSCEMLLARMEPIKQTLTDKSWENLVTKSNAAGIDLRAMYMYSGKDKDVKSYDIYGLNLTEVEVDILTGEFKVARLDVIEDAGKSLSPDVDIGQIEGSIVMGLGLWLEEKLVMDPTTGRLITRNTWEYKVPFPKCIPEDFRVTIMRKGQNPFGVLRSKATGEPPLCLAVAVLFAMKNAIVAARKEAGIHEWFQLNGPVTPEDVVTLCKTNPQTHFTY